MRFVETVLTITALALAGCQGVTELGPIPFSRASWQHPEQVVASLELEPRHRVADLGAGDGFFVPYLSDAVGEAGRVYAVDVEAEITQALSERFDAESSNVEPVLGEYSDPKLPDGQIDLVLIVNTYHHIENRPLYFARLRSDLSEGGRVAIIEPDQELTGILSLFLDDGHTSSAPAIVSEMQEAGYRRVESFDFLPTQVFEIFEPLDDAG